MINVVRLAGWMAVAIALTGCAEIGERDLPPERVYIPYATPAARVPDGSIFSNVGQESLLGREKARAPGDLVTILIEESVAASASASSNSSRASTTTALTPNSLSWIEGQLNGYGIPWPQDMDPSQSSIGSTGEGGAEQAGNITGEVTAVVTEVLPNGLLAVRGYKRMTLTRGAQIIRISGLVRPADIQPDNTIRSRRLADAEISVAGRGELADASRSGWMNRALLRLWPF